MPKNYYIPDPSIKRLAYVAGVKELSSLTYEEMRGVIRNWLEPILRETMIYAINKNKKTLNEAMISASLPEKMWSNNPLENSCKVYKSKSKSKTKDKTKSKDKTKLILENVKVDIAQSPAFSPSPIPKTSSRTSSKYVSNPSSMSGSIPSSVPSSVPSSIPSSQSIISVQPPPELFIPITDAQPIEETKKKRSKRKQNRGNKALREIRYYQKNSGCLNIPIETFSRVVREVSTGLRLMPEFRLSKNGLLLLQHAIESYVVELLRDANNIVVHADRIKLMPKDIALARKIRRDDTNFV